MATRQTKAGYTLLEVVIAASVATVLVGGLASSLYIASRSLEVSSGELKENRDAHRALAIINRDLHSALTISNISATSVTMSVPDRNGDAVPEIIRYAWSGSPGDPLTQEYNGGAAVNLAANVQSFSLGSDSRMVEGVLSNPYVLFVSSQPADDSDGNATPSTQEQIRIDLMESWGYHVTPFSQDMNQSKFNTALTDATVVYVSGEVNAGTVGTKLNDTELGVVTESFVHAETLGFYSSLAAQASNTTDINVTNTSHYITSTQLAGDLVILSSNQQLKYTTSNLAADAVPLADVDSGLPYPTLLILDKDDLMADGNTVKGRRCQLPWGEGSLQASQLNANGQVLMQRSIEWALGYGADTDNTGLQYHDYKEYKLDSNGSSVTIDIPSGTTTGDLMIAFVATDGDEAATLSAPAGWTEISVTEHGSRACTLGVWWKVATASESSSYDFTWAGNEHAYGLIMRFSGQDSANPINASATETGSSNSPTAPAVTTSVDGCLILRIGGFDRNLVNQGDTGLSGHTTIFMDYTSSSSSSSSGGAGYFMQTSAGDTGTADFSLTGSEQHNTVTIAIAPYPGT